MWCGVVWTMWWCDVMWCDFRYVSMLPWQPSPYSHCSVLRRRGRRVNYEIGLWPLTLLLFNHVVYTSMAVVKCPLLIDYDGRRLPVSGWGWGWSVVWCVEEALHPKAWYMRIALVCVCCKININSLPVQYVHTYNYTCVYTYVHGILFWIFFSVHYSEYIVYGIRELVRPAHKYTSPVHCYIHSYIPYH